MEDNPDKKFNWTEMCLGAVIGGALCAIGGVFYGTFNPVTTHNTYSITYQQSESDKKVMRVYRPGTDSIFVQTNENRYESLQGHLKRIRGEKEREQEKSRIEKIVGWDE